MPMRTERDSIHYFQLLHVNVSENLFQSRTLGTSITTCTHVPVTHRLRTSLMGCTERRTLRWLILIGTLHTPTTRISTTALLCPRLTTHMACFAALRYWVKFTSGTLATFITPSLQSTCNTPALAISGAVVMVTTNDNVRTFATFVAPPLQ